MDILNNLQERNNSLKSKLRHEQLKYGTYSFNKYKDESLLVLDAYEKHKSIFKAASSVGLDRDVVMKWFMRGMNGDPKFRPFYLSINNINGVSTRSHEDILREVEEIDKMYEITSFEDAWVYTTEADGEKISIISGDLDNLRQKVKARNLPLL